MHCFEDVDARHKAGHDEGGDSIRRGKCSREACLGFRVPLTLADSSVTWLSAVTVSQFASDYSLNASKHRGD